MQELNSALKTFNTVINLNETIVNELLKVFDILLKDREKLSIEEINKFEKNKATLEIFNEHLLNGGTLATYKLSSSDMALVKETIDANDKSFLKLQENNDDKDFLGKFNGKHFAFESLFIKNDDASYMMFLKNTDLNKFVELKAYLDENNYSNNISLVKKDITNILKIDESKPLMTLDILNDQSYEIIANALNANKIPFEVANQEHGVRIVYEKENKQNVLHTIDTCKVIDPVERALLIANYNKDFNNRKEAQNEVDKLINNVPQIDKILQKNANDGKE